MGRIATRPRMRAPTQRSHLAKEKLGYLDGATPNGFLEEGVDVLGDSGLTGADELKVLSIQ